jgi:carbonic anhydrase
MEKLVKGVHHFQKNIFSSQRELFEQLAKGQRPETLFITCSDSRVVPNQFTQTDPGELFILRNAGNIVPPYGAANGGEGATIEYAVAALGVKHIIVCGHSQCGAVTALLKPGSTDELPAVNAWLAHAESTRRIVRDTYKDLSPEARLSAAIQENVLCQLENLRTHPSVASAIATGQVHLHGWVYKIQTGDVFAYDPERGQFVPVTELARSVTKPARNALEPLPI